MRWYSRDRDVSSRDMDRQTTTQIARDVERDAERSRRLSEIQLRTERWLLRMLRDGRPLFDSRTGAPVLDDGGKPVIGPPAPTDLRTAINYLIACGVPRGRLNPSTREAVTEALRMVANSAGKVDPFAEHPEAPEVE